MMGDDGVILNSLFIRNAQAYKNQQIMQCELCMLPQPQPLLAHIAGALAEKYSSSAHFHHIQQMEAILQDLPQPAAVDYRESHFLSDDQEYLKRFYQQEEHADKMCHLSEYYKFSRDLPKCHDSQFARTIEKYHDKLRELDFKKVKAAVKREQGFSLTSYRESSSLADSDSNCELKSRYSSVLHGLNEDSSNQSNLLNHICQEIDEAIPSSKQASPFKGYFPEGSKHFQNFLLKEDRKTKGFSFKKGKGVRQSDKLVNKESTLKTGLNLIRNRSKKVISKNHSEKTRANDTWSREEKSKKVEKYFLKTIDHEHPFKPLSSGAVLLKQQPKNMEQIYKAAVHTSKYNSSKEKRKSTDKRTTGKTPSRSKLLKSHQSSKMTLLANKDIPFVLDTDRLPRQSSKKTFCRSSVHKSIERNQRLPSLRSFKTLPQAKREKERRQKSLSRSKSKPRLSKQGSRSFLKVKPGSLHSTSQVSASKPKGKVQTAGQQLSGLDRLLNKKLALFMH